MAKRRSPGPFKLANDNRESTPKPVTAQLPRQLTVHPEALRNWIGQDEADRGERDDRPRRIAACLLTRSRRPGSPSLRGLFV